MRSSAWMLGFASTQKTTALSGGLRYTPTISRSFSTNRGSFENLNRSTRCGWSRCCRQILRIVGIADPLHPRQLAATPMRAGWRCGRQRRVHNGRNFPRRQRCTTRWTAEASVTKAERPPAR